MAVSKKSRRCILYSLGFIFILLNTIAFFHAWHFTHFSTSTTEKTPHPEHLSVWQKTKILFTGVSNPKPKNKFTPTLPYQSVSLPNGIKGWYSARDSAKGCVILFHGYLGEKSSMIERSKYFYHLGYSVFLIDFRGSGESSGTYTTIGFEESEDVFNAYNYIQNKGIKNIYLQGTSMGAAAILKCQNEHHLPAAGLILECPFARLQDAVNNRFKNMGIPRFPMAHLLVFWGGIQHGFNGFTHNPATYAKSIKTPTLLIYGTQDNRVSIQETNAIFTALQGPKKLSLLPQSGHADYLIHNQTQWHEAVSEFLRNSRSRE